MRGLRITGKDLAVAGGAAVLSLAVYLAFGAALEAGAIQAAAGAVLVVLAVLEVHRRIVAEQDRTRLEIRRIEPLLAVYRLLPLRAPLPAMANEGWSVPPDSAALLISLVREVRPRTVLETGCGISTLVLAYALEGLADPAATVIAIEHDPKWAAICRRRVAEHGLEARVRIVEAPLVATDVAGDLGGAASVPFYAPSVFHGLPPIDLVFADAPPAEGAAAWSRYPLLSRVAARLTDRAVVVLHYVRDVEREIAARWMREHPGFHRTDLPLEKGVIVLRRAPG